MSVLLELEALRIIFYSQLIKLLKKFIGVVLPRIKISAVLRKQKVLEQVTHTILVVFRDFNNSV